jgi:hypothetical protein
MATDAILETIKPRRSAPREELPVTTGGKQQAIGLRRRMSSSFSVSVRPLSSSAEALRRARSMPSAGALRRWWEWGLDWVMARRAPFARGLGMSFDDGEGTWRHVFHRVRAGARRLLGRDGRPQVAAQDFRYDSVSYAQNFDAAA